MGIADFLRKLGGGKTSAEQKYEIQESPEQRKQREILRHTEGKFRKEEEKRYDAEDRTRMSPSTITRVINKPYIQRKTSSGKGGVGARYSAGGITYRVPRRPYQAQRKGPGRPRQSYKLRMNPLTGKAQLMPAQIYYRLQRKAKSFQSQRMEYAQAQRQQAMARQGISPEQAQQIEMMRQMRMQRQRQMPQPQQMQQRMPNQAPNQIPIQMQMRRQMQMQNQVQQQFPVRQFVETDILTGRRFIKQIGRPRERWLL